MPLDLTHQSCLPQGILRPFFATCFDVFSFEVPSSELCEFSDYSVNLVYPAGPPGATRRSGPGNRGLGTLLCLQASSDALTSHSGHSAWGSFCVHGSFFTISITIFCVLSPGFLVPALEIIEIKLRLLFLLHKRFCPSVLSHVEAKKR